MADAIDALPRAGRAPSPYAGNPVALKYLFDIASAEFSNWSFDVHPSDADFVFQLSAGAMKVGLRPADDVSGDSRSRCAAPALAGDPRLRVGSGGRPARSRRARPYGGGLCARPRPAGRRCAVLRMGTTDTAIAVTAMRQRPESWPLDSNGRRNTFKEELR
jgi:hypothetical protein